MHHAFRDACKFLDVRKRHYVSQHLLRLIFSELGDSEFDIFTDENGRPTVEICVEDFNPSYKLQQGIEGEAVPTSGVPIVNGLMFAVLVVGLLGVQHV